LEKQQQNLNLHEMIKMEWNERDWRKYLLDWIVGYVTFYVYINQERVVLKQFSNFMSRYSTLLKKSVEQQTEENKENKELQ